MANSLNVACPVCKVAAGVFCKRPRSRKGPHAERIEAAVKHWENYQVTEGRKAPQIPTIEETPAGKR